MAGLRTYLIAAFAVANLWGADARAEESGTSATAVAPEPTDDDLLRMSLQETIEIYEERPDKPFDRDTDVRLTGEQLAKRGATDLATALALLPDVSVRDAGRGGFNIDIRGARKGAVSIFIDGVLVSDPYYGTFDVSSIPVTDIVQIRVATTPQSPIDGPGGPGGVIEVHTRDAIGGQVVVARLTGDSLPSFGMSGTARAALAKHVALRIAASGLAGARDLELPMNASVGEGRRAATGSSRLEYRKGNRRLVLDGFLDDRHYLAPPGDSGALLMIDRETTWRVSAKADDKIGNLAVQGQSWAHRLNRRSRNFRDPGLSDQFAAEDLNATRVGGRALLTQPVRKDFRWAASATIDREQASVDNLAGQVSQGDISLAEVALDGQYERKRFRIDVAGGVAIPFGVADVDPWPEAKAAGKYRPRQDLELTATVGYKGRVPTLRERFDQATGNPELGPEFARHAEVRAIWEGLRSAELGTADDPAPRVRLEVAPFTKKTTGSSRVCASAAQCPDGEVGKLEALDAAFFYGVDVHARVKVTRAIEIGGSYAYIKACELGSARGCDVAAAMMGGADPLDRLPRHRADGWVQVSPNRMFSALARVRHAGAAVDRNTSTEAYTLVEANVSAQLSKEYLAVLRVDDATDVRPETRNGFRTAGRIVTFVFQGTWE
jgi:hypothetical protein